MGCGVSNASSRATATSGAAWGDHPKTLVRMLTRHQDYPAAREVPVAHEDGARAVKKKKWVGMGYTALAENPLVRSGDMEELSAVPSASPGGASAATSVTFRNDTEYVLDLHWLDYSGGRNKYSTLSPGQQHAQPTFVGHIWLLLKQGTPVPEATGPVKPKPPYQGTVWFTPKLVLPEDPTAFISLVDKGKGPRTMFDRRLVSSGGDGWLKTTPWLFIAGYGTHARPSKVVEVQVNPEFSQEQARLEAEPLCVAVGKLPAFLLQKVDSIWLHDGDERFGGGNRNLLMYTRMGRDYAKDCVLEECLIHEATHTSMDDEHKASPGWEKAQKKDACAISDYAQDNPGREDLAESMGPYLAFRFRPDRLTKEQKRTVQKTIPNRIAYLDSLKLSMDVWV